MADDPVTATSTWPCERVPVHETHWIEENAWRAHRYGVRGRLVDLDTGIRIPTRERLRRLIDEVEPWAERFAARDELAAARVLLVGNGADRQRVVRERLGLRGIVRWLADETERSALRL